MEGRYFDGRTSRYLAATLSATPDGVIRIAVHDEREDGPPPVELKFTDLSITSRLGNTPRELAFHGDQVFTTEDNDAVDRLVREFSGASTGLLYKLESRLLLAVAASVFTLAFLWFAFTHGVPGAAEFIANRLPDRMFGQSDNALDILDMRMFSPSELSPARELHLRATFAPYLQQHAELRPRLYFRSLNAPNAFALPDGSIVLTDELVELAEHDEQLTGILFHELGHLHHKHMARRLVQGVIVALMVVYIIGDVQTIDLLNGLPALLIGLSHSRDFEREADSFALERLCANGIAPAHLAALFLRMEAAYHEGVGDADERMDAVASLPSTHPSTRERIKLLESCPR